MKSYKLLSILVLLSIVLASCVTPTEAPALDAATEAAPVESVATDVAAEPTGKVCVILDSGGVDDKGYNQSAWDGAQQAGQELNWEAVYLVSQQQTDWEKNITEFVNSNCSLIVAVGWVGGDALKAAAIAHPEQKFQIVDSSYDPVIPNVWAQLYAMEEGSLLAGYLAAGVTQTGKVAAFGGMNIPPVADFFIGFAQGVDLYNTAHDTSVEFMGWSNETLDGNFVGDFNDTEAARRFTESYMDEGADIILPQSGSEALASAAAVKQRGGVMTIGADADQYLADAASGEVYLTTIQKHLDVAIVEAAHAVNDGTFEGGTYLAHLADGGVGLAPFHGNEDKVPADLVAELDQLKQDIVDGKIVVENWASLSAK